MGTATVQAVQAEPTLELVACVGSNDDLGAFLESSQADVAIDFTTPERVASHLRLLIERRIHPIIGTTGLTPAELDESVRASAEAGLGGLVAPNFSIGAVLMMEFAERAARFLPEAEVIEYHHPNKIDAPSGTALRTQDRIHAAGLESCPIHSVRLSSYLAHQEVILARGGERLIIRHDTSDRACFMPGVLLAIRAVPHFRTLEVGLERALELDL